MLKRTATTRLPGALLRRQCIENPPLPRAIHRKNGDRTSEKRGSPACRVGRSGAQSIEPSVRAGVRDPRPQQTHRVGCIMRLRAPKGQLMESRPSYEIDWSTLLK